MESKNKLNPYLAGAAFIATLGGFLFGFDMAVISGVLPFVKSQFNLSPATEGWFVTSALVGCIIGVFFSGSMSDRLGRKKMLMFSAVLFLLSAVGAVFSSGFTLLVLARILGGTGVGTASIVAPLYLTEISPTAIRGRLVTFYQLAITAGILVAYLTNTALLNFAVQHSAKAMPHLVHLIFVKDAWRAMLGLGALPAIFFLTGLIFIPESPRWLIQKGRRDEGLSILSRLKGDAAGMNPVLQNNDDTNGSYKEIFSAAMRRPLTIALLLPLFSQFSGINAVIYYGPQILNAAGLNISKALEGQVIFGAANFLFTLIAIWKVDQMGRRPLYLTGSMGACLCLLFTGCCFYYGHTGSIALVIGIVLFLACFAFSIGPLKFVIAAEIFPTEIRGRAMGLSIMVMWMADTIVGQLTPILLDTAGPAITFCFFSGCCLLSFWTVYKLVPETKGKSLEDVQKFWIH
jgi:SP family arabinose:H+ symporter-like MFS transporter